MGDDFQRSYIHKLRKTLLIKLAKFTDRCIRCLLKLSDQREDRCDIGHRLMDFPQGERRESHTA